MNPTRPERYLIALVAAALTTQVYAATWRSVQDRSRLEFTATYEGADAPGQFTQFEVNMGTDPVTLAPVSLLVNVDINSAGMGNADIDQAIAESEWLDAAAFPHAVFQSKKIHALADSDYAAEGVLSLKGVDKPVTVPFRWRADGKYAAVRGSLVLSRTDFAIGSGEWEPETPIAHAVQVHFDITLKTEE